MPRWSITLLDSRRWIEVHEAGKSFRAELHSPVREASLGYSDHTTEKRAKTVEAAVAAVLADTEFDPREVTTRIEARWRERR